MRPAGATSQTGVLPPRWFELFYNRFGLFVTRTPKCFWCVTESCVNTLFGDSAGEEKLPLVAMADDKGDRSEVDPKNITIPSLEDLPNDGCQLYEK
jgi:hypothetical protein